MQAANTGLTGGSTPDGDDYDRGIVLVLDHRLATKNYGRAFMRSLPPARVVAESTRAVMEEFGEFLRNG